MNVTSVNTPYAAAYEQPSAYRKTQLAYDALANRDQRLNSRQRQLLLLIDRKDDSMAMIVQSLMTDENLDVLLHYGLIELVQPQSAVPVQQTVQADIHKSPARLSDAEVERQVEAAKNTADRVKPVAKLYSWLQSDLRRPSAPPVAEPPAPVQAMPEPKTVVVPSPTESVSAAAKTEFVLTDRPLPSFLAEPEPEPVVVEPVAEVVEPAQPTWQPLDFEGVQMLMRETLWQTCGLMGKPLLRKVEAATTVDDLRRIQPQWKTSILEVRYREQSATLKQALLDVKENLARL